MKEITLTPSGVTFDEAEHRYFYNGKELQGITSTLLHHAFPDMYEGVAIEQLDHAANRGTAVHKALRAYYAGEFVDPNLEDVCAEAKRLLDEAHFTPIAWEYIVTDFERFASPIDIVCLDEDGDIVIVDIKTTAQLQFGYVSLQTGIYCRGFLRLNPALKVAGTYVLWLSIDDDCHFRSNPRLSPLQEIESNSVEALKLAYDNDLPWDKSATLGSLPAKFSDATTHIIHLIRLKDEADKKMKELNEGLKKLMEQYHVYRYQNDLLSFALVPETETTRLDSKRLLADHPELRDAYMVTSKRKSYLKITERK